MKKVVKILIMNLILSVFVMASGGEKIFVDTIGREVKLNYPVKTAVVADRYNNELIRACGAIDKVIGVDLNTAQDRDYWPQFDPKDVIGKDLGDLNYERIIEINPDVVVLPEISNIKEAEEKLEPFGIKVVVISGYITHQLEKQVEVTGKLFGVEDKASYFFNYFNDKVKYIDERIKDGDRKTIYLETTKDFSPALPGSSYNNMLIYAKLDNILTEQFKNIHDGIIDPEEVLKRNPDVIGKLITTKKAIIGSGVSDPPTKEEFQERYQEIINRPTWDEIKAIKNDDVYFMTQFSHGGAAKLVGAIYLAKSAYPELLPDLDPDEVFEKWMVEFQQYKVGSSQFYSAKELKK